MTRFVCSDGLELALARVGESLADMFLNEFGGKRAGRFLKWFDAMDEFADGDAGEAEAMLRAPIADVWLCLSADERWEILDDVVEWVTVMRDPNDEQYHGIAVIWRDQDEQASSSPEAGLGFA